MSDQGHPQDELNRLLADIVEGKLSHADQTHLAALLRDSPELRSEYVDYLLLDAMLHWEQPEVMPASAEPDRSHVPGRRGRWYASAAAGALAAGVIGWMILQPWFAPAPPLAEAEPPGVVPTEKTVALLTHTSDVVWDDEGGPARPGGPLAPGRLKLKSGTALIEFYSGASVILQGPAELRLISRTEAYCSRGRARVTVPPQVERFSLETPGLGVTDRGIEYGLSVGDGDRTEVHVFAGKAGVYDADEHEPDAPPTRVLEAGQGVRHEPGGGFIPIRSDPTGFMAARELDRDLATESVRRNERWLSAVAERRRDPSLRLYFTFQGLKPFDRTLTNSAPVPPGQTTRDGLLIGCLQGIGRWPGKQSLEFRRVSDRVRVRVPGEFASATFAAWVRIDSLPNVFSSLLMADGWEAGEAHWQVRRDGALVLGVQSEPRGHGINYLAPAAIVPGRFGQWTHLAVTYDRDDRLVSHFVDGRPVAVESTKHDIPLRIGDAEVGNWNPDTHPAKSSIRYLNGCIDELMFFTRALSAEEVGRLYAEGRPTS